MSTNRHAAALDSAFEVPTRRNAAAEAAVVAFIDTRVLEARVMLALSAGQNPTTWPGGIPSCEPQSAPGWP